MGWFFKDAEQKPQVSAYDEGIKAFNDGVEFWQNPHVVPSANPSAGAAWFAGWCFGKQMAIARQDRRTTHPAPPA